MKRPVVSILIWLYWTVCFVSILLLTCVTFVLTFWFDPHRKISNKLFNVLGWMVLRPIPTWHFDIRGADKNKLSKPTIVVANHQSFLDLPLLNLLPWSMKWVGKKSLLRIPIFGWIIAMTGHIMIDRNSFRSFKAMDKLVEPIQQGIPGMIFPEGTRTRDGHIQPFKNGAFSIAKQYNFQVLPIVLHGGHHAMPPGTWKFCLKTRFIVSVLDPVDAADFNDAKALKQDVRRKLQAELKKIQSESP